ncbi:MAG: hypothetical protein R3C24_06050 [Cyanobacteriota/Melainabacteria group bacterium]
MSHVRLDEADAKVVAAYLIGLPADESFEMKGHDNEWKDIFPQGSQFKPHKVSKTSREGRKLFYKKLHRLPFDRRSRRSDSVPA